MDLENIMLFVWFILLLFWGVLFGGVVVVYAGSVSFFMSFFNI